MTAERFVNVNTNQPIALVDATSSTFGGSGASHSVGLVPDPGSSAGTTRFLREDGTWAAVGIVDIGIIIDGGGAAILAGQKGQVHIPFAVTITKWWIMGDQSGSITVDVLRANDAVPSASMVGGGTKPNLSTSQYTSAAPSGWTSTTLAVDDWITFSVTGSPTSVTRVSIALTATRTG